VNKILKGEKSIGEKLIAGGDNLLWGRCYCGDGASHLSHLYYCGDTP